MSHMFSTPVPSAVLNRMSKCLDVSSCTNPSGAFAPGDVGEALLNGDLRELALT